MSPSAAKAQLYSTTLDQARRQALFNSNAPATTKGSINPSATHQAAVAQSGGDAGGNNNHGVGMDWKELLRKFNKHNPSREVVAAAAHAEQVVYSLYAKAAPQLSTSNVQTTSTSLPPLPPPLPASSHGPAHTALDALDRAISHGGSELELASAQIVKGVVLYHMADFIGCVEVLGRADMRMPDNKSNWEGYDLALRVVGHATEGYALEQLGKELEASASYTRAAKAYNTACDLLPTLSSTTASEDLVLHQSGEAALYRLCLWSNKNSEPHIALPHHRLYIQTAKTYRGSSSRHTNAARTFHPARQQAVLTSLRALISASGQWHEMTELNRAQEAILRKSTSLPKAGDVNVPYVRFLDDVADGWKRSGAGRQGAQEVVEIMYNALTHTFQSHRLLRHLSRALVVLGRHDEAGKALRLYLDLFDKSKQTDPEKVNRELRKYRQSGNDAEKSGSTTFDEKAGASHDNSDVANEHGQEHTATDTDTDIQFIETMTFGARVFCKFLDDPTTGVRLAKRAREILNQSNDASGLRRNAQLESRVELALGIALGALTAKNANPDSRPTDQAAALGHLEKSASLDLTSWETRYHLAFQLAELRQISPALDNARRAVELAGPGAASRDAWHLLGLLVAAQKDMRKALQVLETALEEVDDDEDDVDERYGGSGNSSSRVSSTANGTGGTHSSMLNKLSERLSNLPPPVGYVTSSNTAQSATPLPYSGLGAASKSAPTDATSLAGNKIAHNFDFFQDQTAQLVSDVQLRMTKNVVIEVLEGPEAALLDQQALLSYFASAYARVKDVDTSAQSQTQANEIALESSSASKKAPSMLNRPRSIKLSASDAADRSRRASLTSRSRRSLALEQAEQAVEFLPGTPGGSTGDGSRIMPNIDVNPRATKLLVDLWLMSAASYRRAGRLEDAKGAIAEAETLNADDPDVWVQFALYHLAKSDLESAQISLHKSLSFALDHPPALILLSKLFLTSINPSDDKLSLSKQLPFAEGILETLTKRQGWDAPEAWFELSRCFRLQPDASGRRKERERECLVWALQLEETRSVRRWDAAVPRLL